MRLDCLFISRKGRKGRRTSNANYAIAEVAADFVATAGAVATETIGANTAPARRRALATILWIQNAIYSHQKYISRKGKSVNSVSSV